MEFVKVRRKAMTRDAKRALIPALAAVVIKAVITHGRRGAHFLFEVLQGRYDSHMERAQMRFAPVRPRSWREIQIGIRQSDVRFDDFKQGLDHVDNCAAELVPLQMSTQQSDVIWQQDTTLPDILPVVVPLPRRAPVRGQFRSCEKFFRGGQQRLGTSAARRCNKPVDGCRPASMRLGKSPWVNSGPSGIVASPVSLREHVGNGLCIPSVMC
jgi:hypothetical protein